MCIVTCASLGAQLSRGNAYVQYACCYYSSQTVFGAADAGICQDSDASL